MNVGGRSQNKAVYGMKGTLVKRIQRISGISNNIIHRLTNIVLDGWAHNDFVNTAFFVFDAGFDHCCDGFRF